MTGSEAEAQGQEAPTACAVPQHDPTSPRWDTGWILGGWGPEMGKAAKGKHVKLGNEKTGGDDPVPDAPGGGAAARGC